MNRIPRRFWISALLLALVVTLFSPFASSHPDGLERVAEDQGFGDSAQEVPFQIVPDYAFPGVANSDLATVFAGIAGTLLVGGLTYGLARLARRRSPA